MGATHSPVLGSPVIPLRLVALDEGTDILLDRAMLAADVARFNARFTPD